MLWAVITLVQLCGEGFLNRPAGHFNHVLPASRAPRAEPLTTELEMC